MKISLFEAEDLDIIQTIQPPDWSNLKTSFKYYLNHLDFCKPIKIILENKIVGIGTTIIHKDVAWLAQIVVHPDFRNRGIGSLITKTLIENLKNDSCKTILLIATEMGQPVYEKIGFEVVGEYSFLKNNNVDEDGQISKNIIKPDRNQFDEVLVIDFKISGEDRSNQLSEYYSDSFIYIENKKVQGCFFPSFGDGLIIAENYNAGIELVKLRIKKNQTATLPIENVNTIQFLKEKNFIQFRTAKRMSMGEKLNWHPEKIFNRVSGQIG